jgi:hypothetical protein
LPEVTVVAPKPPDAQQISWAAGTLPFVHFAAAVHVRLRTRQPCKPNVLIIFTTEPQRLMDDVAARKPRLLGFQYIANIPKVKTMDHPIQAWYVTGSQGTGGVETDDIWAHYPIGSISDYVAMATLSQTRIIDGCGELPSILDLMAPDCKSEKSEAITGGDMAYLRALYSIDMRKELFLQRAEIESRMMQEFAGRGRPSPGSLREREGLHCCARPVDRTDNAGLRLLVVQPCNPVAVRAEHNIAFARKRAEHLRRR